MAMAALAAVTLFSGCSESPSRADKRAAVVAKYGTEIADIPSPITEYIARKPDGSIWYVRPTEEGGKVVLQESLMLQSR